jgi:hypothetical protein
MVLLNEIIQIGALPDPDRLQLSSRPILKSICRVAGQDRLAIGLAAVDDDALRPAMPLDGLTQKPLGGCQISPFAKPKFNRIAVAVDYTIKIPPLASHPDICLVDMPLSRDGPLAAIEPLQQFG